MAYTRRPFNPLRPYVNQVVSELNQANNNFDILAKAFQNDDPSTLIVKRADTVDGFHASRIPAPNTIPVAGEDGKISIDWLPPEIVNRSNTNTVDTSNTSQTPTTVPYWTVLIDSFSRSNTTPADFFTGRYLTIIRRWMSYGVISWYNPGWGPWSTLWTMKVRCPLDNFPVDAEIVSVQDYVYVYLNKRLITYAVGAAVKTASFQLYLDSGENLIQVVHNNRDGSAAFLLLNFEFDWRVLEFIPTRILELIPT